jgi:NAD(P)-dependent dehydrogenase (short-subunit alcohol dehydrogenase family)
VRLGVRINIVAPGPVETEMLGRFAGSEPGKANFAQGVLLKRLGRPEEIADTIVFVASPQASFISGASIPVNGGKARALRFYVQPTSRKESLHECQYQKTRR